MSLRDFILGIRALPGLGARVQTLNEQLSHVQEALGRIEERQLRNESVAGRWGSCSP